MAITSYDPIIAEAARRFNVPEDRIRAVMKVESGGQPWARSPKGASGLMQIMPDTYQDLRRELDDLGPDRYDPRNNIMGGTAYMRQMYDQFGNWDEATLAYNMGPGRAMQVRSGTATVPAETAAYGPKVKAALATFGQGQGQGGDMVPGLIRPQPGQRSGMGPMFGAARPNQSLTGLLEVEDENNFYEGLGGLLNVGQEPSQPPRTDPAALPGTTQTDRLDMSGRINELLQQYLQQPQKAMPSQLQYMLGGAGSAVGKLAGVRDRKVGIGELLGALGGGVTAGGLAHDEAQQQRQGSELAKLLQVGAYQNQSRTAALNEASSIIDNRYKDALTRKALAPPAPETYTLAPGGRRVDAAGNIIAENPPTPPAPQQPVRVDTAEGVFLRHPDGTMERVGSPVSTVQKQTPQEREAILESDKAVEAGVTTIGTLRKALDLNKKAFSGVTAGARAWVDRVAPGEWGGTATTEFQNLIESGALTQLKTIFGGNPTEGERKILLDLQASVNKSEAEREVILNNAIAAAEARVRREQQRAEALRKGTYYTEALPPPGGGGGGSGGSNVPAPPPGFEVK